MLGLFQLPYIPTLIIHLGTKEVTVIVPRCSELTVNQTKTSFMLWFSWDPHSKMRAAMTL